MVVAMVISGGCNGDVEEVDGDEDIDGDGDEAGDDVDEEKVDGDEEKMMMARRMWMV